jgi:subfamily B ATP-binding cassette protein MsbA
MIEFFRHLLKLARPYRLRLGLGVLFGILAGLGDPLLILLLPLVGRTVFRNAGPDPFSDLLPRIPHFLQSFAEPIVAWLQNPGYAGSNRAKIAVIALIPLVVLLRGIFTYLNAYLLQWVGVRAITDLRTRLFAHLQTLSLSFFSSTNTGELISRITSDTSAVQNIISNAIPIIVKDPVTIGALAVLLFGMHPQLTIVTLIVLPILVLPVAIYNKKIRRSSTAIQTSYAELANVMHEGFTGGRIVKAYNLEETVVERFRSVSRKFISHYMRTIRAVETPGPVIEFLGSIGVAVMFYIFAVTIGASPEKFIQFVVAIFAMYRPLKNVIRLNSNLHMARSASERVFQLLATRPTVVEPEHPKPLNAAGADIHFDHVTFLYDEKPVLRGVDLTIKAGQMCALVGRTGSGKTTITNLLLRFYDPQKGAVRIGNTDVREVSLKDLRSQMAVVSQDTILFNESFRSNLALGRPGASEEEIIEAARRAHAHEFIMEKEGGYDFVIGEKGSLLSGGQKQRLTIARAILRNAPILILDEATNALDAEVERAVQAELDDLMKGRTTLCIAHRLSTIQRADLIVVMHEGQIVETGTHATLLERGGLYKKLHELQFQQ